MSKIKLEARNIALEYGAHTASRLVALADINLTIHENEFVSIVGPSGCGKTTFLSVVDGLIVLRKPEDPADFGCVFRTFRLMATRGFMDFMRSSKLSTSMLANLRSSTPGSGSFASPERSARTPITKGICTFFWAP